MKAYFLGSKSGAPVLELRDIPKPEPKAGEVLIKVRAASLNRGELMVGHGVMAAGADAPPAPFGLDVSGEVAATGPGVSGWTPGDKVFSRVRHSFAELALADVRQVMAMPDALSWEQAASVPVAFLTAYDMLVEQGRLAAGEWVLVAGVSSGVGVACLQIAKALGAKAIGTSGSADKLKVITPLGLDHAIHSRGPVDPAEMKKLSGGHGIDIAINLVGGSVFESLIASLAYRGRLATVGYVDGVMSAKLDLEALHRLRLNLYGVSNKHRTADERALSVVGFKRDVLPHLGSGRIRPLVDKVFPFAQLREAQARMLTNQAVGKIVISLG